MSGIKESLDLVVLVDALAKEIAEGGFSGDIFQKLQSLYDLAAPGMAALQGIQDVPSELGDLSLEEMKQLLPQVMLAVVKLVNAIKDQLPVAAG